MLILPEWLIARAGAPWLALVEVLSSRVCKYAQPRPHRPITSNP